MGKYERTTLTAAFSVPFSVQVWRTWRARPLPEELPLVALLPASFLISVSFSFCATAMVGEASSEVAASGSAARWVAQLADTQSSYTLPAV